MATTSSVTPTPVQPRTEPASHDLVLVGNPNVGKSVLFGWLTGTYVTVSNYPGTTVEVCRSRLAAGAVPGWSGGQAVDTPGTNTLIPTKMTHCSHLKYQKYVVWTLRIHSMFGCQYYPGKV